MTKEELLLYCREVFSYNQGKLYYAKWIKGIPKSLVNTPAGSLHKLGYRAIKIKGKIYREHVLVWLMFNGNFPYSELDHCNRDYADNRIENLREATRNENCSNRTGWNKHSQFKGIQPNKRKVRWEAYITIDRKKTYLGVFDTPEEAAIAYDLAAIKNNPTFSNTNFPKENYNVVH